VRLVEVERVGRRKNNAKMTKIMTGQSQFRHVGGGGGADGLGLSPGGGGVACLLMAAPCVAQYARYSRRDDQRAAYPAIGQGTDGERSGNAKE
jgi:hypothetical protein